MRISVFCRRFISCLLACFLLISVSFADTIDLSSFSNDEIVALLAKVNDEVVSRGINKTAKLPQGAYIAGKDLPAGRYIFTCLAKDDDWGNLTVKSDQGSGKLILWEVVTASDEEPATVSFINIIFADANY